MTNKKYLPLKIIHLALTAIVFVLSVVSLKQINSSPELINPLSYVIVTLSLIALSSGFGYLAYNSNKEGRMLYKVYMYVVLLLQVLETSMAITTNNQTIIYGLLLSIQLVLYSILTVGKDLGKKLSYGLSYALIACAVILAIFNLINNKNSNLLLNISSNSALIILAVTTTILVIEKYIDKDSRGSK